MLPVATLTIVSFASWMRYQRGSMIEALAAPFVRTARAKGFRNASSSTATRCATRSFPTVTLLGIDAARPRRRRVFHRVRLLACPAWDCSGINSVFSRDYPTVMGITLLSAILVVLGNLLADVLYAFVDPRIRYE